MKPEIRALAEKSVGGCRGTGTFRRGICLACVHRTGKPDRKGGFTFNTSTGWYQCFKCGLAGRMRGYDAGSWEPEEREPAKFQMPEAFYELCRGEGKGALSLDPAREYLRKRGLTNEAVWKTTRLGASLEGRFRDRLIIPILSPDEVWLGYVGRAWSKHAEIPYLYPKGMNRKEVLYNHAALLVVTDEPVFVVEGVLDAIALWPNAVAVLGKPSEEQIFALIDASRPVAVCLDGDAWREGRELAMRLQLEGQRAGNIQLPPGRDPDEMPLDWLKTEAEKCLSP